MKKQLYFSLLGLASLLLAAAPLSAQLPSIDLRHNGGSTIYADFSAALAAAVDEDTMYLSGGAFPAFTLDKKLAIIGVGHHPDSTTVTFPTIITGGITFSVGSSGSFVTGLKCAGITIQSGVENIRIARCLGNILGGSNCVISECVGSISGQTNSQIFSCIGWISGQQGCVIQNNVFVNTTNFSTSCYGSSIYSTHFHYCFVANNLMKVFNFQYYNPCYGPYHQTTTNSTFLNNIWAVESLPNGGFGNGNFGNGNIQEGDWDAQFVNFPSGSFNVDNYFQWNYHLVNPAYNTGGTDGTPIGIYGGIFPWKAGSVPFTPHINPKIIAPTTNSAGYTHHPLGEDPEQLMPP